MTTTDLRGGPGPQLDGGSPPAVHLRNLSKNFGAVQAVRNVDLTIDQGEVVAFLGPNGAGKTSTIDMILGLSTPSGGQVSVLGMTPPQAIRRGLVSAVMQTGGLLKDLTVGETALYTASLFAQSADVPAALRRAGIAGIADRRVGKCSGGEQQRLRFAMALLSDPELLILDEPTTAWTWRGHAGSGIPSAMTPTGPCPSLGDALPGGGRRLRRPDRAHPQGRIVAEAPAHR
jgi:ABC-2 type transport system ATP-binding protein